MQVGHSYFEPTGLSRLEQDAVNRRFSSSRQASLLRHNQDVIDAAHRRRWKSIILFGALPLVGMVIAAINTI